MPGISRKLTPLHCKSAIGDIGAVFWTQATQRKLSFAPAEEKSKPKAQPSTHAEHALQISRHLLDSN